ncbi:Transcriptional regulator, LysR family [Pseudomonas caricapapayae]|uniref:Transcriptional regulator, LysR family n=1 Tax=Pseudomonas caricapapayae TaxID=46678 RepID=A0A0N8QTA3_9PSED|nr:LysR family transcriptional regulator [Pseudomonas caricapapayae]KAA8697630.1 LysR family transcriptional regulator [Pseudomonas caricapapayae]KPW61030.1 Transcriptional regulator, LysR family [Pseudomonas caricapapayae]RMM07739.1 Transcriptional regulator, LysR family [Pseudomonas caricapapayae]RMV99725.1 Transcriptional regulator, LysR family [Pseudomonas caricapapayae]
MNPDIRALDLNLLKALDALLDERSVTRAANRLSLTQPAVSGMLNRLRESFDDPLFVRAQRGIVPTLRAEQLAMPVKQLLANIEGMLQPQNFDPLTASMTIRIASTDYALRAAAVPFLSALRVQAPNIRVSVQPVDHQKLQNQLDLGEIDLALVTPEAVTPGLHAIALFDESYVCVMRSEHPDAMNSELSLDRFCALDHVLVSPAGGGFHGVTDEALEKLGRSRRVTVSVISFLVLPEILMCSDLIAVVPRRLAVHQVGLRSLEPPVEIPGFRKTLVWHERTHSDAGHRWVRSLMVETIRALD